MKEVKQWSKKIKDNVGRVFFGKDSVVDKILAGILCRGHVLLEDVPGLGKTVLAKSISISLGGTFNRIQCTPDLLPNDIIGISIYRQKEECFTFTKGPIHGNIVLVDEINRATPRTQSAFLEAMAEYQVSIDGEIRQLPEPFFLIATENPVEFEGTFPLPEAQKDRFFMTLNIGYPSRESEELILETHKRTTHPVTDLKPVSNLKEVLSFQQKVINVHISDELRSYILDLVEATRINDSFHLGVSPRGSLALYKGAQAYAAIKGRDYVIPEDVKELFVPIFMQRVLLKTEHQVQGLSVKDMLESVLDSIAVPGTKDIA